MVVGAAAILGKEGMGPETEVTERGKRMEGWPILSTVV